MANVALFHPSIMRGGGGESVAAHTMDSLATQHRITLFSLDKPEFPVLDERHGTNLTQKNIDYRDPLPIFGKIFNITREKVNKILNSSVQLDAFLSAIIQRTTHDRDLSDFEIIISTANEFTNKLPVIQYIHFPIYTHHEHIQFESWAPSKTYRLYRSICSSVAGYSKESNEKTTFVANSDWTADLVREAYNTDVRVIYPPVAVNEFNPKIWRKKENGFVAIGRIHPSKDQKTMIKILDRLNRQKTSYHLHIIGGVASKSYGSEVKDLAANRPYVHLEGYLNREELIELVENHRYGLHAREYEHFGIAVAELLAGGCIPFVPHGGGQMEIVGQRDQLLYSDIIDAVEKIQSVAENKSLRQEIRRELRNKMSEFGTQRFRAEIQSLVNTTLSKSLEQRK